MLHFLLDAAHLPNYGVAVQIVYCLQLSLSSRLSGIPEMATTLTFLDVSSVNADATLFTAVKNTTLDSPISRPSFSLSNGHRSAFVLYTRK